MSIARTVLDELIENSVAEESLEVPSCVFLDLDELDEVDHVKLPKGMVYSVHLDDVEVGKKFPGLEFRVYISDDRIELGVSHSKSYVDSVSSYIKYSTYARLVERALFEKSRMLYINPAPDFMDALTDNLNILNPAHRMYSYEEMRWVLVQIIKNIPEMILSPSESYSIESLMYQQLQEMILGINAAYLSEDFDVVGMFSPQSLRDEVLEYAVDCDGINLGESVRHALQVVEDIEKNVAQNIEIAGHIHYGLEEQIVEIQHSRLLELREMSAKDKGEAFEEFIKGLMVRLGGLRFSGQRVLVNNSELDLVFDNMSIHPPFDKSGPKIIVECKNWESKSGVKELRDFETKIRQTAGQCSLGIFVSMSGFTSKFYEQLKYMARENYLIIPVSGEDIDKALGGLGIYTMFLTKYDQALGAIE